jgi:hypothetical protein
MLGYMKRRLKAYIDSRVAEEISRVAAGVNQRASERIDTLLKRIGDRVGKEVGEILAQAPAEYFWRRGGAGWSGEGDPLVYHRMCVISALSEGVAAIYGYDIEGHVAEFGTMTGETAAGLARAIANCDRDLGYAQQLFQSKTRELHLFDSFAGLPPAEHPLDMAAPHVQDGAWAAGSCRGISAEELAKKVAAHIPEKRVRVLSGWFRDTVPQIAEGTTYALIHIDSDLYASALDALDGLFGRCLVARGALIYFDDWNCNRASPDLGERRAWRECTEKYGIAFSDEGGYGLFARRFTVHDYRSNRSTCCRPSMGSRST